MGLLFLETAEVHTGVPAWVFGIIAFGLLMGGLFLVRSLGHRRPHSR